MSDVYRLAEQVSIWLGENEAVDDVKIGLIMSLAQFEFIFGRPCAGDPGFDEFRYSSAAWRTLMHQP